MSVPLTEGSPFLVGKTAGKSKLLQWVQEVFTIGHRQWLVWSVLDYANLEVIGL